MPQLEYSPRRYTEIPGKASKASSIHLQSENNSSTYDFTFQAVRPNLFRVTFTAESHPLPPYPNVPEPQTDLETKQVDEFSPNDTSRIFDIGDVRASIEWKQTPVVSLGWKVAAGALHSDLEDRSYVIDGPGIAHYTQHDRQALHIGLGEKAAPMDLTARHFITSATDCFGYDVYKTDPMYKHIPLLIKATPEGCVAIFSTSHSRGTWSVGSEIDGLWGHFKVYRQDYGGLEEYLIIGRTIRDVVRTYAEHLAGLPLLVPRWAYGYLSGGYKYTMGDDPPAHEVLMDFAAKLEEHDIPCSAHQMSSGYSIAETEPKVRNVFTWNRHRFPDPEAWLAKYHSLGIRLMANIKPYLLESHPDYNYLADAGGLFKDPYNPAPTATMKLWSAGGGESGNGSHIDFTSAAAFDWWSRGAQKLRSQGVDAMWNDNNEYPLPNDAWTMALEQVPGSRSSTTTSDTVGLWGRAMHTELMAKASHDAMVREVPDERPFVLTRSATPGTLRYACSSWSGDNVTSWAGMKGANAQNLNAGISLMQCYGPDIGGFEGPQPSPELLLRWVQIGIYSPRFAINCFKTSPGNNSVGEVIEPWMYPEITPLIRDTIKRRYEILPYIYSLGLESHMTASPSQRWIGWGYESDPEVWTKKLKAGEEQFWFGDTLLVGGVYDPGVNSARIYLPREKGGDVFDYGYVNINEPYEYLASGQWVTVQSEWKKSIPIVAKVGGGIPIGRSVQTRMPGEKNPACRTLEEDDWRGIEIFPPQASSHGMVFISSWYEDDGISRHPDISKFSVWYSATEEKVTVALEADNSNKFVPLWTDLDFILLPGDRRHLVSEMGVPLEMLGPDSRGRPRWRLRNAIVSTSAPASALASNGGMVNGVH